MRKIHNLNGVWDFEFLFKKNWNEVDFSTVSYPEKISVPGCFDAVAKYENKRGTGIYRTFVDCGNTVKLELEATGIRGEVRWDGKQIALLNQPYTPQTLIFNAGSPGKHELVVATDNFVFSGDDSVFSPFYDFYPFGGIYRNVTLTELPEQFIDRVEVLPQNTETGEVLVRVETSKEIASVDFLFDTSKAPLSCSVKDGKGELRCCVPDFKIWSTETPFLHTLKAMTGDDELTVTFGIRTIECKEGKILLNGKALKLIGWNRHESHPAFGAAVPEFLTYTDLQLIKEQGSNFIRGCHYKQSKNMLDLCDRMGLLVWEESLGWGNREAQLANENFRKFQCEQTAAMVRSSINHPCVIMWGFLNECASDTQAGHECIEQLCKTIRALDPSRPITFASNRQQADICLDLVDIISINTYPGWYDYLHDDESEGLERIVPKIKELEEFVSKPEYINKPFIVAELGAAAIIGDHSGVQWSEEYQADLLEIAVKYILESPRASGIALWQFCNAKTYNRIFAVIDRPRGYNNKGAVDEFRRPKLGWKRVADVLKGNVK
ncbi:MAG: hypothetical protein IKB25_08935 [Lentisphaeria bacterium]|nr:hypothetical protein [Lentisphaeria bacterium]